MNPELQAANLTQMSVSLGRVEEAELDAEWSEA
jgi:hypothetical protein